jgi:hypothetical protein
MDLPPLVTAGDNGIIGDPETVVLFGDEAILDDSQAGFRIRGGLWMDGGRCWGWQGEYWSLGDRERDFAAASDADGAPLLFRPFFNINPRDALEQFDPPAREDAELVSSPNELAGTVAVRASSELSGAGIHLRRNLGDRVQCVTCTGPCGCAHATPKRSRWDLMLGYRYARLHEGLMFREDLTSLLAPPDQGRFAISDRFGTTNDFNGFDLGMVWQAAWNRWSLELLGRLALGNVQQQVEISGNTRISGAATDNGDYVGGLLAQRTNIGTHRRDVFGVIPELGLTLGYCLRPNVRLTAGYTFLYWSRVVRPGEQIDLDVNPDLLAPELAPLAGPLRPRFDFRDTDYWAQGLNFGLQVGW